MKSRLLTTLLLCVAVFVVDAAEKPPHAAIATAHPLATEAGMRILQQGGNAFDAAVAITATIGVVEPFATGLGGGGFWLLHRQSDGRDIMIDGREKAPGAAGRNMYLDKKGEVRKGASINGPLAAGIPGVPAGLVLIARKYGKLPLAVSLKPAIDIARNGFTVSERYRRYTKIRLKMLQANPSTASIYLVNNNIPPPGYVLKQPDLAKSLETIARSGANGFYRGQLARKLVEGVKSAGGIWSLDDLKNYKAIERKPIVANYRGMKIISASLPSSGGIVLAEMVNMLSQYKLENLSDADRKHLMIEVMRRAYHDRAEYLGDSDFVKVPVKKLISMKHAKQLAKSIHMDEATLSSDLSPVANPTGKGADTTHFSVLDKDGNRVSATLSINFLFGSCYVPPGTGILLNDEMDDFSAKPGSPNVYGLIGAEANAIAPNKRPLSSMSPTILENKRGVAILGTPGGSRIISMLLIGLLEYAQGGNAEQIVDKRRFHHQYMPDVVMYENGAFSKDTEQDLMLRGHILKELMSPYGGAFRYYGDMQAVVWDKQKNTVTAASDKRGIGEAVVR